MSNELSIISADENINLQNNKTDVGVTLAKAVLGIVPLGSFFGETLTGVIPNQRVDRIALGLEVLNQKLKYLPEDVLQKLRGEYSEMLYEIVTQLSKTRTEDRRNHLASLLKNSLTDEALDLIEKEKLLQLLGQINDAEVIHLVYHSLLFSEVEEFEQRHAKALGRVPVGEFGSKVQLEKDALVSAYQNKLVELGLIRKTSTDYSTTGLGVLLLRYIDQFQYDQADYQFELQKRSKK